MGKAKVETMNEFIKQEVGKLITSIDVKYGFDDKKLLSEVFSNVQEIIMQNLTECASVLTEEEDDERLCNMTKVNYVGAEGQLIEIEKKDLFNACQFIIFNRIRGAKIKNHYDKDWQDADDLIAGLKQLFE